MSEKICLIFDTDSATQAFFQKTPIMGYASVFVEKSFNNPKTTLLPDKEKVEVISSFAYPEVLRTDYLDMFPNLKLITTRSTGFNHIDLAYAAKRGIVVENVPNYGETTVAEFTIGTMIGLSRKIYKAKSQMKANKVCLDEYVGIDLCGHTLGVIGTGAIGRHVIKLAQAFGMKILAHDPYPSMEVPYVDLPTLYEESDIITLHCPATAANEHLLNETSFAQMKRGVLIVNTARGSLIETESLYKALKSGQVGGAALDVLENEDVLTCREFSSDIDQRGHSFLLDSVINFKMMQLDNTIITPHIAFNSVDAVERILQTTLDNINSFVEGKIINRQK